MMKEDVQQWILMDLMRKKLPNKAMTSEPSTNERDDGAKQKIANTLI